MTEETGLCLTGFRDSVYSWAVRWALAEAGLTARYREVNPFDTADQTGLRALHPFGQVPVLRHGDLTFYETAAILTYLDRLQPGAPWTPEAAPAAARMVQVMSLVNGQVYWPLVRQVFSNGYYLPHMGQAGDAVALRQGLERAPLVLAALDAIAGEGLVLDGRGLTLADLMLGPMLVYFTAVDDGARMVRAHPALDAWLTQMVARPHLQATRPPCLKEARP